jgi:hypothetical protein
LRAFHFFSLPLGEHATAGENGHATRYRSHYATRSKAVFSAERTLSRFREPTVAENQGKYALIAELNKILRSGKDPRCVASR